MDLRLYFRVIWRFRIVVGIGLLLACLLSFLSYAKISFKGGTPKVSYRQSQTYSASALLFLTQKGFPYGYTVLPYQAAPQTGQGGPTYVPQYATPGTFSQLAQYYAPFADSDAFRSLLRQRTHVAGAVKAQTVLAPSTQYPQPYIEMFGYATKPANAVTLANVGSDVFSQYLTGEEIANHIPTSRRVVVETVSRAQQAVISTGRKKTTPIVVFLTVLLAAVGLSFMLENLRPRIRPLAASDDEAPPAAATAARRPA